MIIRIDPEGSVPGLAAMLEEMAAAPDVGLVVVLAGEDNGFEPAALDPLLQTFPLPLAGGVFPKVIHDDVCASRGTVVLGLQAQAQVLTLTAISDASRAAEREILFSELNPVPKSTLLMFVDGLNPGSDAVLDSVFNCLGLEIHYVGAAAGSSTFQPLPCVFSNRGLLRDAAVVALLAASSGVGVAHGWEAVGEGLKVTEAEGNRIISLDWQLPLDAYRAQVEAQTPLRFAELGFGGVAQRAPFGISRLDCEMVARAPLLDASGQLVCAGGVPQGSFVYVLRGSEASLLQAAAAARTQALAAQRDAAEREPMVLIDCISRACFLGERFGGELATVRQGHPLVGMLSLGEIANTGRDFLEFFNCTAVVVGDFSA